jgi:hypothetical protein
MSYFGGVDVVLCRVTSSYSPWPLDRIRPGNPTETGRASAAAYAPLKEQGARGAQGPEARWLAWRMFYQGRCPLLRATSDVRTKSPSRASACVRAHEHGSEGGGPLG